MESKFSRHTKLTYGEGAVGAFPRGAIKHPSLVASACVLFDSVTLLRPIDIEGTCMFLRGEKWNYRLKPNQEAADFWSAAQPLLECDVLRAFHTQIDLSEIENLHVPPEAWIGQDTFDIERDTALDIRLFAVGFTEYFRFLGANGLPLVLARTELHGRPIGAEQTAVHKVSQLSDESARILRSFLPELGGTGCDPKRIASYICEIRKRLQAERLSYMSLVGKIVATIMELPDPNARAEAIDQIASDCVDIWSAYKSKLTELSGNFSLPLKFVPLLENLESLDQIDCGEHLEGVGGRALAENQRKQMVAFIWQVNQTDNYWRKR